MKQLSGNYSEIDLVRSDSVSDEENRGPEPGLKLLKAPWGCLFFPTAKNPDLPKWNPV